MNRSQYLLLPKQMGVREIYQFSAGGDKPPALLSFNTMVNNYCNCGDGDSFCLHLQMATGELEGPDIPAKQVASILEKYKRTMDTVVMAVGKTKVEDSGRVDLLVECETHGVELWGYHDTILIHMYFTDKRHFEEDYERLK